MSLDIEQIRRALATVIDTDTGKPFSAALKDRDVSVVDGKVSAHLQFGYPLGTDGPAMAGRAREALLAAGATAADVTVGWKIIAHAVQPGLKPLPNVRNIIAIASGKGGVGKSTTSANVALALAAQGARVGILDADIYGPSQPTILGIEGRPESKDNKTMEPLWGHGLQANSIGFLVDAESPAIWRGPMVTRALEQLLTQTNWDDLDYLIVDMPPGTGDIALTLAQKVPVAGAAIVTTPQDLALMDARKGLKMFEKVSVPVLGIVENMAVHVCSNCGHAEHIFGEGGGKRMAEQFNAPWLGELPLAMSIREQADCGKPTVVSHPEGPAAAAYLGIARRLAAQIDLLPKDTASLFPPIVTTH